MRRFVLKQNIARFEQMLRSAASDSDRAKLETLLAEARRDLGLLVGSWTWTCPHLDIADESGAKTEQMLSELCRVLGAKLGSLQIWDEEEQTFYLIAHQFDDESAKKFAVIKDGQGTVSETVRKTLQPVTVEDFEKDERFPLPRAWASSVGIRSVHTTPLISASGKFLGTFSTHYTQPRALTYPEREINAQYAARFAALFGSIKRK